jgi:hypothetical protein
MTPIVFLSSRQVSFNLDKLTKLDGFIFPTD